MEFPTLHPLHIFFHLLHSATEFQYDYYSSEFNCSSQNCDFNLDDDALNRSEWEINKKQKDFFIIPHHAPFVTYFYYFFIYCVKKTVRSFSDGWQKKKKKSARGCMVNGLFFSVHYNCWVMQLIVWSLPLRTCKWWGISKCFMLSINGKRWMLKVWQMREKF